MKVQLSKEYPTQYSFKNIAPIGEGKRCWGQCKFLLLSTKLVVIISILTLSTYTYAQTGITSQQKRDYNYALIISNFKVEMYYDDDPCTGHGANYFYLATVDDSESETKIQPFDFVNYGRTGTVKSPTLQGLFLSKNAIKNIHIAGYMKDEGAIGGCNSGTTTIKPDKKISLSNCISSPYSLYVSDEGEVSVKCEFNYEYIPLHTLTSETIINADGSSGLNIYLPVDQKVNLYDKSGFEASLYHYQYLDKDNNWQDISPTLYSLNKLSISAKDILGNDYENYIGKKISFRAVSCLKNRVYTSWSDVVTLTVTVSASTGQASGIEAPTCSDSNDGSIVVNFDRKLYSGEKVEFFVSKSDIPYSYGSIDVLSSSAENFSARINGLASGDYKLNISSTVNGESSSSGQSPKTINFTIPETIPVDYSVNKVDANCFGSTDGGISVTATGGKSGKYLYNIIGSSEWIEFSGGSTTLINGLGSGDYSIRVKDSNGCIAKVNNEEKVTTLGISQPSAAFEIPESSVEVKSPTGYGLSNGYITLTIKGGTPNSDGSYTIEWRKESADGEVFNPEITTDIVENPVTIKADNFPAGKFYLIVKDKNYVHGGNNSCNLIIKEFLITQPDPLIATLSIKKCISCNINNSYGYKKDKNSNNIPDEAEDGSIKALVKGGVGVYSYKWQKKKGEIFQNIENETTDELTGLTEGSYKLIVTDENDNKTQVELFVEFPPKLELSLQGTNIKCCGGSDGTVSVAARGGKGKYNYEWNTGETNSNISNLKAGRYFVLVHDSAGCTIMDNIIIKEPDLLIIEKIDSGNPLCKGTKTGFVDIEIKGGTPPYMINWSNGLTGKRITNLAAANYDVVVTDINGCRSEATFSLNEPEEFTIQLGKDITLCKGDSAILTCAVNSEQNVTFLWTNMDGKQLSTDQSLIVKDFGKYVLQVTTLNGCVARDTIEIMQSTDLLKPEFMIATETSLNQSVILVNTSPITPETVEWIIPDDQSIKILNKSDDYLELLFTKTSDYTIGLKGTKGKCEKTYFKTITVTNGHAQEPNKANNLSRIVEFNASPNPNLGKFMINIKLNEESPIRLSLLNVSSQVVSDENLPSAKNFTIPFYDLMDKGSYILILKVVDEIKTIKLIVN